MKEILKFKDFQASEYKVVIDTAANGFIIRVGCKRFVCEDLDEMMTELLAFFKGEFTEFSKQFKSQMSLNPPQQGCIAQAPLQEAECDDEGPEPTAERDTLAE
ncbi:hypothetical protein LCGC14_2964880 [marine sediment metagenome]|uniref:Uncharacterized protein n=1 Tax=marine sediment metagenome TaxID=412755 RepID=A0A0F8XYN3_9ZZZZ